MKCPECGSGHTQKSSAFYEQNVRTSEGQSTGLFLTSRGTIGVGKARHRSRSSNLAAEANAPPQGLPMRSMIAALGGFLAAFVTSAAGGGFLLFIGFVLAGFAIAIFLTAPNDAEIEERRRWDHQWYCKKCGANFCGDDFKSAAAQIRESRNLFISPVTRSESPRRRQEYIERVRNPIQRARAATDRDLAGLEIIRRSADSNGSFDPDNLNCDLGVISRLSSLGLIKFDETSARFVVHTPLTRSDGQHSVPERGWWQRTFGA